MLVQPTCEAARSRPIQCSISQESCVRLWKTIMVWNVSFLKMVQQTSLGSETASLRREGHSADNLYQRSLCLSPANYLWPEYSWLQPPRWLSHYSIMPLSPSCKPQLWIHDLERKFRMHNNTKCAGQRFRFSNTVLVFFCLIYENVVSPNCKHISRNCFENKVPS